MPPICLEIIAEIHQFLPRNELERSQLVNNSWYNLMGLGIFQQKRVFDLLWIRGDRTGSIENSDYTRYVAEGNLNISDRQVSCPAWTLNL